MVRIGRASALFLICGSIAGCARPVPNSNFREATDVDVALPLASRVTDYEEFVGHTEAILSVQVRSRVTGYLREKHFRDGDQVQEGDLLYEIDDRVYKAALDRAKAQVDRGEARRRRLESDYRRASQLFRRGAIGRAEFDLVASNFAEAQAGLQAARADLSAAELNYGFTRIKAPMTGQISRTLVDPGNLVRQETTPLTDIVAADRLYVYFDLSVDTLAKVRGLIGEGRIRAVDGKEVPVQVGLPDEEGFSYQGTVNFSENKIDAATGTLRIRGIIENPSPRLLSPGVFVRVRLPIGNPHPTLLVAEEAVGSDQGRRFVYVVDARDEVVYKPVEIGPTFDGMRSITKGLAPDERIVSAGLQRVRPGSKVSPRPAPAPKAAATKAPLARL